MFVFVEDASAMLEREHYNLLKMWHVCYSSYMPQVCSGIFFF